MISGDKTYDRDGKACKEIKESDVCVRDGISAQNSDLGKGDEGHQKSVNTLCTGQQLKDQDLRELFGIFCDHACRCLTGHADAPCGAHARKRC